MVFSTKEQMMSHFSLLFSALLSKILKFPSNCSTRLCIIIPMLNPHFLEFWSLVHRSSHIFDFHSDYLYVWRSLILLDHIFYHLLVLSAIFTFFLINRVSVSWLTFNLPFSRSLSSLPFQNFFAPIIFQLDCSLDTCSKRLVLQMSIM